MSRRGPRTLPPSRNRAEAEARDILGHLTTSDRSLLDIAERKTTVRIDGRQMEMTLEDAARLKMIHEAIGGNSHAGWLVASEIERAKTLRERQKLEDLTFWIGVQYRHRERIRAALAVGEPEPVLFPHPDDMEFDKDKVVTFHGPMNEEQHVAFLRSGRLRDALITQFALECALDGNRWGKIETHIGALAWARVIDRGLPVRMQLQENGFNRMMSALFALTKRELLKRVHAAWQCADRPKPRGWRMPDRSWIEHMLRTARGMAVDIIGAAEAEDCSDDTIASILGEGFARITAHSRTPPREESTALTGPR